MLIQCTFCKTSAKLPDSKEGAKVKCGSCGKVYVARELGAKGSKKLGATPFIFGGAAAVGLVFVLIAMNSGTDKPPPPPPAKSDKTPPPVIDRTGYDSAFCKLVRDIYDSAYVGNAGRLQGQIFLARLAEERRTRPGNESQPAFAELSALQRDDLLNATVDGLIRGQDDLAMSKWRPYDGKVLAEGDTEAEVRIEVAGRAGDLQTENRTFDWKLALDKDGKWKAYAWTRYLSPEEKRAARFSANKEITKVAVEGGVMYQADPRPLPHLDSTPPAQRTLIDGLVEKLLDNNLRAKERTKVVNELKELGKPALPILLTKMYEIQIVDDRSLGQVTSLHNMLKDITGRDPGFSPLGVGPDSEKKRDMAIRSWFAWYLRAGERFENDKKKVGVDVLEGLIEPTERDQREIEKAKRGN